MVSRYYRRSYHFYSVHAAACLSSNINNMAYTCTVVHLPIFKKASVLRCLNFVSAFYFTLLHFLLLYQRGDGPSGPVRQR